MRAAASAMSRSSADKLRWAPRRRTVPQGVADGHRLRLYRIEENALRRAREGVARTIFHKGEQVGEYRHHDERLTMFLLRTYRPDRYGKAADQLLPLSPEVAFQREPGIILDGGLMEIEFDARDIPPDDEDEDAPCAL